MTERQRLHSFLAHAEGRLLGTMALAFFLLLGGFCLLKLHALLYNALDLGIYHQVFANTSHGRLFALTLHPHSYLGDHVELLLAPLSLLYRLFPSAATILLLQVAAVTLAAWPLWILTKRFLPNASWRLPFLALFFSNVFVHNVVIFEFHTLAFAIPLTLLAILAYETRRWTLYALALLAVLLIREDMGLIAMGMAVLALLERRGWRWTLVPFVAGIATFAAGVVIAGALNQDHYKFLAYYGWIGDTPLAMLRNAVMEPWRVGWQMVRLQNALFLVVLAVTFVGLPLLHVRKALVPAVFFLVALFLTSSGADAIAFQTHYTAPLLPFLLWSSLYGLRRLRERSPRFLTRYTSRPSAAALVLLTAVTLYNLFTISPLRPASVAGLIQRDRAPETRAGRALLTLVPKDASVASSYAFLPALGNRQELYSMHYVFSGKRQLSQLPYLLPASANTVLFDSRDFLSYRAQFGHDPEKFLQGDNRLRQMLADRGLALRTVLDSLLLWQTGTASEPPLYEVGKGTGRTLGRTNGVVQLLRVDGQGERLRPETFTVGNSSFRTLPLSLSWQIAKPTAATYVFRMQYVDGNGRVRAERFYPFVYGLYPTTEWRPNVPVRVRYRFLVPDLPAGDYQVRVQVQTFGGYVTLTPQLAAAVAITEARLDGAPIVLGTIAL